MQYGAVQAVETTLWVVIVSLEIQSDESGRVGQGLPRLWGAPNYFATDSGAVVPDALPRSLGFRHAF